MTGPTPDSWVIDRTAAAAHELLPGLWRLRLPTAWPILSHVNAYVIERADGAITLVDCGCGGDPSGLDTLAAAVEACGWSLHDVRELVITHYHSDHAGPAARVLEEVGCPLAGHPSVLHAFEAWSDGDGVHARRLEQARIDGVPEARLAAFATLDEELTGYDGPVVPDRLLVDGATAETALGSWRVLETPGHAPSHICLVNDERRLLIAGDLLAPAFSPWFDLGYTPDPAGELLASLDAVRALGDMTALPGHGRPFEHAGEVAGTFIDAVTAGIESARGAIADGPASAFAVARRLHPAMVEPRELVWAHVVVKGHLQHLVARGRAMDERQGDGTILYRGVR